MKRWITSVTFLLVLSLVACSQQSSFVTAGNGLFYIDGRPYYFIGTNYWYGGILGSPGKYGDRERLIRELDELKEAGVSNIRVLAGAEGPDNEPFRVTPALQVSPGKYNDELLDGLDFLLNEMKKRGQYAVIYLNNSWDWSGGYAQYLNWNGYGQIPYPSVKPNTWPQFMAFSGQFHKCRECNEQFMNFVRFILGRTNRYSGVRYVDDPTIMTWEIGNEPRAFSDENIQALEKMIAGVAALIKEIDANHLVTTGTEGSWGCEGSLEVFERIHSDRNIDYMTMHIWPKNWSWLDIKDIKGTLAVSISKTNKYIQEHIEVAKRLNKPIVLEEFGLPRDFHGYHPEEPTDCRDRYYENAFAQVLVHAKKRGAMAGCNFWTYAGEGRPVKDHIYWKPGDDYLGDPPVEEQGLNSVFNTDRTMSLITKYNRKIKKQLK